MNSARALLTLALTAALGAHIASAQPAPAAPKPTTPDAIPAKGTAETPRTRDAYQFPPKTFYLHNATPGAEANEIQTTIRNLLPSDDKVFSVPSQGALVIRAPFEDLALVQKVLDDLDRPHKVYRLTYAVTEMDDTKRLGVQHFAMVATSGQPTVLKQGSRVPIMTGSLSSAAASSSNLQVSYQDVGMSLEATLEESGNGAMVRFGVEQSSVAEEKSGIGPQDPVLRSTNLRGASFITPGKPLMLGSMDIPGSTRHLDIEVLMEPVP